MTGTKAVGRAAAGSTAAPCRWRWCSSCWRGSGRSSPGARATRPTCARTFRIPAGPGGRSWRRCVATAATRRRAASCSAARPSCWPPSGQEFWSGAARAPGDDRASRRPPRWPRWCGATAAATAATSCTRGWRCCSSAWPPPRPSRPSATCASSPGQTVRSGRLRRALRARRERTPAPEREGDARRRARRARRTAGAVGPQRPARYPAPAPSRRPGGRYFDGQATSEVGLKAGLTRDLWTAIKPTSSRSSRWSSGRADQRFAGARPARQALIIAAIAPRSGIPPAATFRVIASPLVTWIWLGGAHRDRRRASSRCGPRPSPPARRARAGYAARVAPSLGRA